MIVDKSRSYHFSQTFHIDRITEEEKKENYEGSDSNKNESFCSEAVMASEGSEDEIDENESQQEVSPRLKQKEIRVKLRSYYDAGISKQNSSVKILLSKCQEQFIIILNYSSKNDHFNKKWKWKKIHNYERYWFKN